MKRKPGRSQSKWRIRSFTRGQELVIFAVALIAMFLGWASGYLTDVMLHGEQLTIQTYSGITGKWEPIIAPSHHTTLKLYCYSETIQPCMQVQELGAPKGRPIVIVFPYPGKVESMPEDLGTERPQRMDRVQ